MFILRLSYNKSLESFPANNSSGVFLCKFGMCCMKLMVRSMWTFLGS